jgi:hypothetical protein
MKRAIGLAMVLLAFAPAVFAQPEFRNAGARLVAEEHPPNRVVQSGEEVTVSLALKNVGNETVSNLIATIQSGEGVLNPSPPAANYGVLIPFAPSVAREFTFVADAPTNSLLVVKLKLTDSGRDLGTNEFRFRIGPQITSATNSATVTINPLGKATPFPSVLSVSNAPGTIINVSLTLSNLSHGFPDDLDILLVSPSGDAVMVMSDACGVLEMTDKTITLTDHAAEYLPDFALPTKPVYRPANYDLSDPFPTPAPMGPYAGVMSAFNGKDANGDWKLYILDDFPPEEGIPDGGFLDKGWALTITTLQPVDAVPTVRIARSPTNNGVRVLVSGYSGHSYLLETGPDPIKTTALESFIMPASGVRTFEFPIEAGNHFFRAATDP